MADADDTKVSEIYYKEVITTMDGSKEFIISTNSKTDEGAMDLFLKVKKEMGR
jgi:hypothetical protein